MIKKLLPIFIFLLILFCLNFILLSQLSAGVISSGVTEVGNQVYGTDTPKPAGQIAGQIIRGILGFLAIVFVILIIYGGLLWMFSQGESEKTKKARQTIVAAVIGLAIILSALAITEFVLRSLYTATTTP